MKNDYEIRGDITAIFLKSPKYGQMESLISTNKLQKAHEFPGTWCAHYNRSTKSFYVHSNMMSGNGYQKNFQLHRWITNAPSNLFCDHINHDTLDNTDENLRLVTNAENAQNKKGAQSNSSSGIRGVSWHKASNKWIAQIKINKKAIYVGIFDSIEEAEQAVIAERIKYMPYTPESTFTRIQNS